MVPGKPSSVICHDVLDCEYVVDGVLDCEDVVDGELDVDAVANDKARCNDVLINHGNCEDVVGVVDGQDDDKADAVAGDKARCHDVIDRDKCEDVADVVDGEDHDAGGVAVAGNKETMVLMLMLLQAIKHDYFSYFPDRYLLSITMIFGDSFPPTFIATSALKIGNWCVRTHKLAETPKDRADTMISMIINDQHDQVPWWPV